MRNYEKTSGFTFISTVITAILVMLATFFWFFSVTVDGTQEGVFVKKPVFFGSEGIDSEPLTEGRQLKSPTTSVLLYSILPERHDETFDDLLSSDKVMVDFVASITLSVQRGKSPVLHGTYGYQWYENNVKPVFQEYVRSFAKDQTGEELIASSDIVIEAQDIIQEKIEVYFKEIGLPVQVHRVTIGKATPNRALQEEMDRTSAQRQRSKTEDERKKAEDSRLAAEQSKAHADKAYMQEFGMTISEYLQLRNIEIEMQKLELVKTKDNVQILMMSGSSGNGVLPTYDVRKTK